MITGSSLHSILRAIWQFSETPGRVFLFGLPAACAFMVLGLQSWYTGEPSVGFALVVFMLIALPGLWVLSVVSLLQQNDPGAARLVPGHAASLRVVFAAILIIIIGIVAVCAFYIGVMRGLAPDRLWATVLCAMIGVGLLLLAGTWMGSGMKHGVMVFVLLLAFGASPRMQANWEMLFDYICVHPLQMLMSGVLMLGATMVLAIRQILRQGDSVHRALYADRKRLRISMSKGVMQELGGKWLDREGTNTIYDHVLMRACGQRGEPALSRCLWGLGTNLHWSGGAVSYVIGMLYLLPFFGVSDDGDGIEFAADWQMICSYSILGFLVKLGGLRMQVQATYHEQTLVMLLPGIPHGPTLNRGLVFHLVATVAPSWLLVPVVGILDAFRSDGFGWMIDVGMILTTLPLFALLLTDWSRLRKSKDGMSMVFVCWGVSVVTYLVLSYWVDKLLRWPEWLPAAVFACATAMLLGWCWQRVAHSPTALPVGRMARESPLVVALPSNS